MKPGIGNGESGIGKARWLSCFYLPLYQRGIEGDLLFAMLAMGSKSKGNNSKSNCNSLTGFAVESRALREFLLSWQKEPLRRFVARTAKPARRVSGLPRIKPFAPDTRRCDEAASVPCAPRLTRHGAQTRCAQTGAPLRPRQAVVLGSL